MMHFVGFIGCAIIIFFAGRKLAYYGDLIAEKTQMSKGWIGLILMASVTSLPELMVGISSSAIVQSADLAIGDILGSCAFNLGILAALDAFIPKQKALLSEASSNHLLNTTLGIILITLVGFAIYLPEDFHITPWIGLSSLIFAVVYFVAIRLIFLNEKNVNTSKNVLIVHQDLMLTSLNKIIWRYCLFASLIVISALSLPFFAKNISEITGLGTSFVGTFFLAVSTSLPEIAVSIAAVKMGSLDLAIGNLLGSNIFNILIIAIDDIFYTKGLLLKDASDFHLISILSTILMSAVAIIGLSFKVKGKRYILAWDTLLISIIYILNLIMLYYFTS